LDKILERLPAGKQTYEEELPEQFEDMDELVQYDKSLCTKEERQAVVSIWDNIIILCLAVISVSFGEKDFEMLLI